MVFLGSYDVLFHLCWLVFVMGSFAVGVLVCLCCVLALVLYYVLYIGQST